MSGTGNSGRKPGTGVADLREGTGDHTQGAAGCLGPPRGEKRERGGKGSSGRWQPRGMACGGDEGSGTLSEG